MITLTESSSIIEIVDSFDEELIKYSSDPKLPLALVIKALVLSNKLNEIKKSFA